MKDSGRIFARPDVLVTVISKFLKRTQKPSARAHQLISRALRRIKGVVQRVVHDSMVSSCFISLSSANGCTSGIGLMLLKFAPMVNYIYKISDPLFLSQNLYFITKHSFLTPFLVSSYFSTHPITPP